MTHKSIPRETRYLTGVTDSLIRISVGLEDVEDLLDDLKSLFQKIAKKQELAHANF
jgi:cystathionine gamma-lyase / homocysteine desulfhydrase